MARLKTIYVHSGGFYEMAKLALDQSNLALERAGKTSNPDVHGIYMGSAKQWQARAKQLFAIANSAKIKVVVDDIDGHEESFIND